MRLKPNFNSVDDAERIAQQVAHVLMLSIGGIYNTNVYPSVEFHCQLRDEKGACL